MRYNNNVQFFVDVPDEMMDYKIPKLIFQPIVENTFLHKILEKEEKGGNVVIIDTADYSSIITTQNADSPAAVPLG